MTVTKVKTTLVSADELKPGMVRVWCDRTGTIVKDAEITAVGQNPRGGVNVQYDHDNDGWHNYASMAQIEVLAEGFEF